ncbi:MAG TPA: hypothetical protein VF584_21265 [Longimicrobium sp.]|jgi:hypothetical protein
MHELSTLRLNLLRAMYLLIAVLMGLQIWPLILASPKMPEHMRGVVWAMLGALTLLCALGVRYPVRMMPLLLFELAWKCIWVAAFGLPLWSAGRLDAGTSDTLFSCVLGLVLVPLVLPWPYIFAKYLKAPGDPWRRRTEPRTSGAV